MRPTIATTPARVAIMTVALSFLVGFLLDRLSAIDDRNLPDGTYLSPSGAERVVVKGGNIHFSIVLPNTNRFGTNLIEHTFPRYGANKDGTIYLRPISTGQYVAMGSVWSWKEPNIVRSNWSSRKVTVFYRTGW